jgi:hypothetical protein
MLGLSLGATRGWITKGLLRPLPNKRFAVVESVSRYCGQIRDAASGRSSDAEREAKRRIAEARAAKIEAEAKALKDKIDAETEAVFVGFFRMMVQILLAVPSRLAHRLGLDRTAIILIDDEIRLVIKEAREQRPKAADFCCPRCGANKLFEVTGETE